MNEKHDNKDNNEKSLFLQLIMMLSTSALQQMGKMEHPQSGETGVDLKGARFSIDMLAMIEKRTAGNLDDEEERLLKSQLATLRLAFVQASASDAGSATRNNTAPEARSNAPASDKNVSDKKAAADSERPAEKKDEPPATRFHKSYG